MLPQGHVSSGKTAVRELQDSRGLGAITAVYAGVLGEIKAVHG